MLSSQSPKSPELSTKRKADPADFENKLKATLAEKQTQIWELEDNQVSDGQCFSVIVKKLIYFSGCLLFMV